VFIACSKSLAHSSRIAEDDAVGTVPECCGQECARQHCNLAGDRIDSFPADGVRLEHTQLSNLRYRGLEKNHAWLSV
jgi:hypothetical protein